MTCCKMQLISAITHAWHWKLLAKYLVPEPRSAEEALLTRWLARFEGERGNYREALAIERGALPIQERVLGRDHPDTLTTRGNIASWTGETGEAGEALRLFRELLPDQERVLGRDHPDTLRTRGEITKSRARRTQQE